MRDQMVGDTLILPGEASSPRAARAAFGVTLRQLDLFAPVRSLVKIDQKTVTYRPDQKLDAAFVTILAGGKRMTAVNKMVRADPPAKSLWRCDGRKPIGCPSDPIVV